MLSSRRKQQENVCCERPRASEPDYRRTWVIAGKPVIKGACLTVEYILNLLAHGAPVGEIQEKYGGLTADDACACPLFALRSLEDTGFMPLTVEAA